MKFRNMVAITAGAVLALSAPALAQTVAAAGLKVGSVVYSPDGSEVGKVERIDGEMVTLNTGTHSATLGSASFSKGPKGPAIGVTKQKLNETIETAQSQDKAKLDAALVAGATVRSSDGKPVGAVEKINPDGAVVLKDATRSFALPRDLFTVDAAGPVLRVTAQQLADAIAKSAAAAPATSSAASAPPATPGT